MNQTTETPSPTLPIAAAPAGGGPLLVLPPPPVRPRRRLAWLLALVLLAGAGLVGWWQFARPPVLALATPWRGAALEAVYATGVVEALDSARVGTTVAARIVTLAAEEGDRVRAGQVIAQLDDRRCSEAWKPATSPWPRYRSPRGNWRNTASPARWTAS